VASSANRSRSFTRRASSTVSIWWSTRLLLKLLERFIAVCNTIAYAHSRGILHRDIKPANVMLGAYGETLILDWGLAKPLGRSVPDPDPEDRTLAPLSHDDVLLTGQGGIVGTPAYMSPEQAAGSRDQLGPASDVYSLGATLYTLLTGRAPFGKSASRKSLIESGKAILCDQPASIRGSRGRSR